jgi:hypothetical protein
MTPDTPKKLNEDSPSPPERDKVTEKDQLFFAALKNLAESKRRSFMDQAGTWIQLIATLATLFVLVYGFFKFRSLDELAKTSETTTKVVTVRYDKAIRIGIDGDFGFSCGDVFVEDIDDLSCHRCRTYPHRRFLEPMTNE